MNKMYLKPRRKKRKKTNLIILILILLIISIWYVFKIFNEKTLPIFMEYSEIETKKIVSLIITSTVKEHIANNIDMEDLFITDNDSTGKINTIDFNTSRINMILIEAAKLVEQNLIYIETGEIDKLNIAKSNLSNYNYDKLSKGIFYELPSGIMFNNPILVNIFPKIPIKLNLIGNTFCVLNTEIDTYGINNAFIKVNIQVNVEVKILLPFTTKRVEVICNIPIIMKIIQGNIPSYYLDGYLNRSFSSN